MLTVGNLLKKAREHEQKTIPEIAQVTRIRPEYLEKIEANDFSGFTTSAHVKGFIRSYASYLGLDAEGIVALFRRQIGEETPPLKPKTRLMKTESVVISPPMIMSAIIVIFFLAIVGFLIVQFYRLQQPPNLKLVSPTTTNVTTNTPSLEFDGYTEANALVSVNGSQIQLRDDNTFSLIVDLQVGANTFTFEAWKKNVEAKKTQQIVTVTYQPKGKPSMSPTPTQSSSSSTITLQPTQTPSVTASATNPGKQTSFTVKTTDAAWIQVISDNAQQTVGVTAKKYNKTFSALHTFQVVSGKPAQTTVFMGTQALTWKIKNGVGSVTCTYTDALEWNCD